MNASQEDSTVIAQRLHLATGFLTSERDWIVQRLAALRSFPDTQVELQGDPLVGATAFLEADLHDPSGRRCQDPH